MPQIYAYFYASPLGKITLVSDGLNITGLYFEGGRYYPDDLLKQAVYTKDLAIFKETEHWLNLYFSGKKPVSLPSLKVYGTPFQKKVYTCLSKIPYGQTTSYREIGQQMHTKAYQAIGQAISHNPISILVPCHRVISKDGSLGGYSGGLGRKIYLLKLEGNTL